MIPIKTIAAAKVEPLGNSERDCGRVGIGELELESFLSLSGRRKLFS